MDRNHDTPGKQNHGPLPPIAEISELFDPLAGIRMPPSPMGTVHNTPVLPRILASGYDDAQSSTLPPIMNNACNTPLPLLLLRNIPSSLPPSVVSSTIHSTETQRRNVHGAVDQFIKLIPLLKQVTADNFGAVLADVLKETEDEVLLEDFFRLLYTVQPAGYCPLVTSLKNPLHKFSPLEAKLKGIALCRLIHDTFMDPLSASTHFGVDTQKFFSATVNAHEFHRVFLAAKILTHCLKDSSELYARKPSLPKTLVYNLYQVYMYRLFRTNSSTIDRASSPESLLLSQQSMGKVMKIMFTEVYSQRLGKRGNTKRHFVGVTWKEAALDDEIRQLVEMEPSQVKVHLKKRVSKGSKKTNLPVKSPRPPGGKPADTRKPAPSGPLLSYVNPASRFPALRFSPRVKEIVPKRIPQQSERWREVMLRSVDALKSYDVKLEQVFRDFQESEFSEELEKSLSTAVSCAEKKLSQNGSSEEAYLHLQLATLMLVFPAVVASDEEMRPVSKILFRGFLKDLVKMLDERGTELPFEKDHRRIFMGNVRKLIHISELILVTIPREFASAVLLVIVELNSNLQRKGGHPDDAMTLDYVSAQAVITTFNAHPHIFQTSEQDLITLINRLVEVFRCMCSELKTDFERMLADINRENSTFNLEGLRFEVMKQFTETWHKWLPRNAVFMEIPMPVFKLFFNQLDVHIQANAFEGFRMRHSELATEAFKSWWLISTAFHEYIDVISEIAALGQRFD